MRVSPYMSEAWRAELNAIVGARHGGAGDAIVSRLQSLDARFPNVAEIAHQIAYTQDTLGRFAEALPMYEKALMLGLSPNEHSAAVLGAANCQRSLGAPEKAFETLEAARTQFPDNREYEAFMALCLHDMGRPADALRLLVDVLAETSEDLGIRANQRSLRFHASRLKSP